MFHSNFYNEKIDLKPQVQPIERNTCLSECHVEELVSGQGEAGQSFVWCHGVVVPAPGLGQGVQHTVSENFLSDQWILASHSR